MYATTCLRQIGGGVIMESKTLTEQEKSLLQKISDLHEIPQVGVFNIRRNGKLMARNVDNEINIVSKKDKDGIDIIVKDNTKNKSVHIPVLLSQEGFEDMVYNDFYIGDNCDVLIVAGCGIHNASAKKSRHNGIHSFHIGNNSHVKYVERHLGTGKNKAKRILDPVTSVEIKKNSIFEMETVQLSGVSSAKRITKAVVGEGSSLIINEKILTENSAHATTNFEVVLAGDNSKVDVVSHAVAKDKSKQNFVSKVIGKAKCFGHVECDGILCEQAQISSTPQIIAQNRDASLVHEAAIGKISQDQQNKLMTMGLTAQEAEKAIINGFLK